MNVEVSGTHYCVEHEHEGPHPCARCADDAARVAFAIKPLRGDEVMPAIAALTASRDEARDALAKARAGILRTHGVRGAPARWASCLRGCGLCDALDALAALAAIDAALAPPDPFARLSPAELARVPEVTPAEAEHVMRAAAAALAGEPPPPAPLSLCAAFVKYARHAPTCLALEFAPGPCSCGLEKVRHELGLDDG